MTVDQTTDRNNEPLRLAALLNIPCLSPGCHNYDPEIPGPLCCVLDAIITKDSQIIKSVLQHMLSAPGIPRLYGTIFAGLRKGNCAGTVYSPSWTPDPILSSECLRLTVDRGLVNPAPAHNTLELFCSLMADPIDSEAMASVGCAVSMEDYGSGSSRPIVSYVNRYLRDEGVERRNRAAGLAWDLAGMLVAQFLDHSGHAACGALSAFPFDWSLMFRVWTLGCQGSRRVAEMKRTGSDKGAANEDLLWGYFVGITDHFDYERDWARATDSIAIAFPDVNWVLECCTRIGECPTYFFRHTFLPTMWWMFTSPQHVFTADPAVIEIAILHLKKSMNEEHGITARSCGVAIFKFIAKRAGVHDEMVNNIVSKLYTHKDCLTDHEPAHPCPVLNNSDVLSALIKSEDIWHEVQSPGDGVSELPKGGHEKHGSGHLAAKIEYAPTNLEMDPTSPTHNGSSEFSLSCEKIALEVCTGRLEKTDSLLHRLEHRKFHVKYCEPIGYGHPFMLALHSNASSNPYFDSKSKPGIESGCFTSAMIDRVDLPNSPEVGNLPLRVETGSSSITLATSTCGIEAYVSNLAPNLMSDDFQHMCRPPLDDQQASLFRHYTEGIPEHLLQQSQTDVFSSDFGNLSRCAPGLAPTRVTAAPEKWRSRCWLMSQNLIEFISLLEQLPKDLGLKPLTALVRGFIDIMSANHVHICSNKIQWSDIHAAIQCAIEIMDEDMLHTLVILLMANITDVPFAMMKNGECMCWMKGLWWGSSLRSAKPDIYDKLAILTLPQPDLHKANRIALQLMGFQQAGVELPTWLF